MLWEYISITRKKTAKNTNTWRLDNAFLNYQQVTEEIEREIKKFLETNDNENMTTQNLWNAAKAVLREYNPTSRNRKTSNRQPNFTPKTNGKRRTKKPQS